MVAGAPNSKEKAFLTPRVSIYYNAPSSLRGTKPVHTITKFLNSFLFHFDSPSPQASVWLCQAGHLWSQYCSAPRCVGQVLQQGQKRCFLFPFSPCKCPAVCSPESASRLGTVASSVPKVCYLWTLEELNSWGRIIMFSSSCLFSEKALFSAFSVNLIFSSIQVAKLY